MDEVNRRDGHEGGEEVQERSRRDTGSRRGDPSSISNKHRS